MFAATLVAVTVIVAERFARVWAPIWIIGMLIGMSILFDYAGTKQTEPTLWIIFVLPVPNDPGLSGVAERFNDLLGQAPRINIASIVAVAVAFTVNPWVYQRMRIITGGRHLWLRQQVAAVASLTVDAIIFFLGAFLGVLEIGVIWDIMWAYLVVAYATISIDTAFLDGMVNVRRKGLFGVEDRIGESLQIQTLRSEQAAAEVMTD